MADLAFVFGIILWGVRPDLVLTIDARSLGYIGVTVLTVLLLCFMTLIDLLIARNKEIVDLLSRIKVLQIPSVPKVISVQIYSESNFVLVLAPTDIFFDNTLVSIFQIKPLNGNDYEEQIGIGRVTNIQQTNKLVQITPLIMLPRAQSIWDAIKKNDPNTISSIICKPSVSFDFVSLTPSSSDTLYIEETAP